MIPVCLLVLFGLTCLWLIVDGLKRRTGVIEFPFLAGCSMLGFLFPQAIGAVRNAERVPQDGLIKALVMCILCLAAVYWGWHARVPARWGKPSQLRCSPVLAYACAMVLLAISIIAFLRLASLSGGVVDFLSVHGAYALEWRGWPVAYAFFLQLLTPGLVLAFLSASRLRFPGRFVPPLLALGVPLASVLFLGRRGVLINLCMLGLCVAFFTRGWLPRPSLAVAAVPLLAATMFLAPYYRTYSEIGADRERLKEIPVEETMRETLAGQPAEFWTMSYIVQVTDITGSYEFGRGLYNTFIAEFVPKLIVGESVKESLFWGQPGNEYYENSLGWVIPYGMVPTGPGSAYRQFWFLGALWFFLLARGLRYLFVRSLASGNLFIETAYVASLMPAISAVVNDMNAVYGFLFVVGPVLILCRVLAGCSQRRLGPVVARTPPRYGLLAKP